LDLSVFGGQFIESCIVDFDDLLIQRVREGFLNLENISCQCYDLCKGLCWVSSASVLGCTVGLMVS